MPACIRVALLAATLPAVLATGALLVDKLRRPDRDIEEAARITRQARLKIWNTPLEQGRCAITVASFGGPRARIVRADVGGTIHFAIIEAPSRPNPMEVLRQGDWLKARFGTAETATLGTYTSKAVALSRAGRLCPPALRCLPGRPGCAEIPSLPNPLQMYGPRTMWSPHASH